jgi:lipopolysaccharide export system protein LptA
MKKTPARAILMLVMAASGLCGGVARGEKADRAQPTVIVADHQTVDDLKQISVFTGHVVLTKGTIKITGDRMEYREDPEGYQYAVVTSAPEELATFHERRDPSRPGVEETIDGAAERIEYDNHADTVRLFTRALVRRFENGVSRDEFSGERIFYDARNSHYDLSGPGANPGGRVVARIAPRLPQPPAPAAPAGAAEAGHGTPQ